VYAVNYDGMVQTVVVVCSCHRKEWIVDEVEFSYGGGSSRSKRSCGMSMRGVDTLLRMANGVLVPLPLPRLSVPSTRVANPVQRLELFDMDYLCLPSSSSMSVFVCMFVRALRCDVM
jgi:hypothetical protein